MDDNTHYEAGGSVSTEGWYCLCSVRQGLGRLMDLLWFIRVE